MKYLIIALFMMLSIELIAQSSKVEYQKAIEAHETGNFVQSISYALSIEKMLGGTNPKIESLLMSAYFNNGDILKAKIAYETLLKITPYSKQQSPNFLAFISIGKQIDLALEEEETKFQDNRINEQKRRMLIAKQIEDDNNVSFETKKKEHRKQYLNNSLYKKALEQDKYQEFLRLNIEFGIELTSKEEEAIKQEKINLVLEGALETKENYFENQKYYLVKYLSGEYALFNSSGEILIDKTEFIISYLGDRYFEINGRVDQGNGIEARQSIVYDVKKKVQTAVLILVVRPGRKYIELHDLNGEKMGFLYGSTLLLPKYDEFLLYGEKSSGFSIVVQNNNLEGVIGTYGETIVPVKYAKVTPKGPLESLEYWCRTVENYKIADKYNYKGQYLGTYKMHKNGNYIKKL